MCERSHTTVSVGACAALLSLSKSELLNSAVGQARGELHSVLDEKVLKLVHAWAGPMVPELRFSCTSAMLDAISDTFQPAMSVVMQAEDVKKQVRMSGMKLTKYFFAFRVCWLRRHFFTGSCGLNFIKKDKAPC